MASVRMCGVVLWSSEEEDRAVIWCEDHGKLAFYAGAHQCKACNDMHGGVVLDAGDLIEFDVEDQADQRRAHNPRLLVEDHAPCIATGLRNGVTRQPAGCTPPANSAQILSFPPRSSAPSVRALG